MDTNLVITRADAVRVIDMVANIDKAFEAQCANHHNARRIYLATAFNIAQELHNFVSESNVILKNE